VKRGFGLDALRTGLNKAAPDFHLSAGAGNVPIRCWHK